MVAFGAVLFAGFIPVVLHYQGLIDAESFGIPENYLYVGGLTASVVGLIAIFIVWRCPACNAYLGKEGSPSRCPKCGVKFG
jgi:rubrerythrin